MIGEGGACRKHAVVTAGGPLTGHPTRHSQEARVATLAISIDLPPTGELETTGNGTSPTQSQMDEETKTRQHFVDTVASYLESLPRTPPHAGRERHPGGVAGP